MRTTLACVALAVAIGTPGVVVGAISSQPRAGGSVATIDALHGAVSPAPPIAPDLRPAVNALKAAFSAQGTGLIAFPLGPNQAEEFSVSPPTGCQVEIQISTTRGSVPPRARCPFTTVRLSKFEIDYSPPSIRPTIEKALANLR